MNIYRTCAALLISVLGFMLPSLAFAAFDTNLGYGSSGSQVIALQQFLVSQGLLSTDNVSGNYYSATLSAVKNFQIMQGISPANGYFGPLTRAQASSIAGGNNVASPVSTAPVFSTTQTNTQTSQTSATTDNNGSAALIASLTAQLQNLSTQVNNKSQTTSQTNDSAIATLSAQVQQLAAQLQQLQAQVAAQSNNNNSTSNTSSTATSQTNNAAIAALSAQVQQLQAQVTAQNNNSNNSSSNTSNTGGTSPWVYGSNGTDVRLLKNGNVGINTSAPTQPLDVRSNIRVATADFAPGSIGTFVDTGLGAASGNTYAKIQGYSGGGTTFANIALNPVSGNVGIGTATPHSVLEVAGPATFDNSLSISPPANSYNQGFAIQQSAPTSGSIPGQFNFNQINTTFNSTVTGNTNSGGTGCACVTAFQVTMAAGGPNLSAREIYGGSFGVVNLVPDSSNSDKVGLASGVYNNVSTNGMLYGGSQGATIDSGGSSPAMLGDEIDMILNGSTPYRSGLNIINMGSKVASKVDAAISVENSGAAGATGGAFKKLIALTTQGSLPQALAPDADFFYAETPMTVANIFNLPNVTVTGNIFNFPHFVVSGSGNVSYSGLLSQSSDKRLKTNIAPLDGATSLSLVDQLNPVSYTRIDQPSQGTTVGFLAQEVQKLFPNLVTVTDPTPLTPGGTLSLNYIGLIAPIVKSIQEISGISGAFQHNLITWLGSAQNGIGDLFAGTGHFTTVDTNTTNTQKICVSDGPTDSSPLCLTKFQLAALLANQATRKIQ